jgi:His-Xaa-Ser system protein HxsD
MGVEWLDADITENAVAFTVDERVYSVEAVLRTAYWFTDRVYIFISKPTEQTLRLHLKTKPTTLESPRQGPIGEVAGEFGNALLDNQLREGIEERTGKIRELLVMKALAEAGVLEDPPPGTPNDPVADHQNANLIQIKAEPF